MFFLQKFIDNKANILNDIDPDRFYVENVRRLYNLSTRTAKLICNIGVRQHFLNKKFGVKCPNCNRVVLSVKDKKEFPDTIKCDICELNEQDKYEFDLVDCEVIEFYQLNKKD